MRQHPRPASRRLAAGAKHVFHGYRQACNRPTAWPALAAPVDRLGLGQGPGRVHPQKRPDRAVLLLDAGQECVRQLDRRNPTRRKLADQFGGAEVDHSGSSAKTAGTR